MAANPSFKKRERERSNREKQQEKDRKRKERRDGKGGRELGPNGEDPDLAGIVAGPQPIEDDGLPMPDLTPRAPEPPQQS